MSKDEVHINFKCPKCGCTKISLPDNHTDRSHATCADCGADFGPYGDIKKRGMDLLRKDAKKKLKGALKGLKLR